MTYAGDAPITSTVVAQGLYPLVLKIFNLEMSLLSLQVRTPEDEKT